jgi:hypothetical protein
MKRAYQAMWRSSDSCRDILRPGENKTMPDVWNYKNLTHEAKPAVYPAGPPWGYSWGGAEHVVYRGRNGNVIELWFNRAGAWHSNDLTVATTGNGAAVRADIDPTGYAINGMQCVVFSSDDHIWRFSFDGSSWQKSDLTALSGAPVAGGDNRVVGYSWGNAEHVVYRDGQGIIIELRSDAPGVWTYNPIGAGISAPSAGSDPSVYVWGDAKHIVYVGGPTGNITELWKAGTGAWNVNDLTIASGGPISGVNLNGENYNPSGYSSGDAEHVVYVGADGNVHQLSFTGKGAWTWTNLSAASKDPNKPDGQPFGYFEGGAQHAVYLGIDNHIHEIWLDAKGSWNTNDLTVAAGFPTAPASDPMGYAWGGAEHVVYLGVEPGNDIHELWFT